MSLIRAISLIHIHPRWIAEKSPLLTLDEKFVNYSLGDYVNLEKMEEIADLAVQYGFEVWVPGAPVL